MFTNCGQLESRNSTEYRILSILQYHSKTLLVRQGHFLFECWPDSAENTQHRKFGFAQNLILEICSLVNCLSKLIEQ